VDDILVCLTSGKSHTGFPMVPKSVTLNDLQRCNFALYHQIWQLSANHITVTSFQQCSNNDCSGVKLHCSVHTAVTFASYSRINEIK